MKNNNTRKLALAAIFTAVAVVGSLLSFPVFGSKCAPVQHIVNILCAVFLGPVWGVSVAFAASLLRNLLGLGSPMAFPGSMIGALLCGLAYKALKGKPAALPVTLLAEIFGTGVLGGLCAYPIATLFMGVDAAAVAFYAYIIPFLISTTAGSIIAGLVIAALQSGGTLGKMQATLET